MQFYYGNQMPLRILDEAEFWKQQEEEHTVVIRELVKELEEDYVNALKEWEKVLSKTHQSVVRFIESVIRTGFQLAPALHQEVLKLVKYCLDQSVAFIQFCQFLKANSEPIQKNPTAKVVLDHIIRESEYFVGIAQTLLYSNQTS
jgi:Txe/YoeB family toxin of Txe-Axe toxin-antitoxin module